VCAEPPASAERPSLGPLGGRKVSDDNPKGDITLKRLIAGYMLALVLVACQTVQSTPEPVPPPQLLPTSSSMPLPTRTPTPEPMLIPNPSPTVILLPDLIGDTFSGASLVYRDTFESDGDRALPGGWTCDPDGAARLTEEGQARIQPKDTGPWSAAILYFSQVPITPNTGGYLAFKPTGTQEAFTLGLDAVDRTGQRIRLEDKAGYSVAMKTDRYLSAHTIQGTHQEDGYFNGDLVLHENTWYDLVLGFEDQGKYIIKIRDTVVPEKEGTYVSNVPEFPTKYYFIGWLSAKRSYLIDDFTIFSFDSIVAR
jgi:hypothetical protein